MEVLCGPHLVLADAGGDDGIAAGELVEQLDGGLRHDDLVHVALEKVADVLRAQDLVGDPVAERVFGFPLGDARQPIRAVAVFHHL